MAQGEIEDQARRIRQRMLEDAIESRQRNSMTLQALQQRTAQRIQETVEEAEKQAEREKRESAARPSENGQQPADIATRHLHDPAALSSREEELRRQHEAVRRSTATRHAHNTVAPIDDDGDDEAEYYRCKSWLV